MHNNTYNFTTMWKLCWIAVFLLIPLSHAALEIGAFNTHVLGPKKSSNAEVMKIISKIIQRYDVILIEEVKDAKGNVIKDLLQLVNKGSTEYKQISSGRLGRTTNKEQYVYFYRVDTIQVHDSRQYADPGDKFEREPFSIRIKHIPSDVSLTLVGVHTDPDDAVNEMNTLVDVHKDVEHYWKNDNILILGDLNAGCSYASKKKLAALRLREAKFRWLIADDVDTTTSKTYCAYDRFIATGKNLLDIIGTSNARVFRFDQKYQLNEEKTKAVSDHYPIELTVQTAQYENLASSNDSSSGIFSNLFKKVKRFFRNIVKSEL